MRLKCKKHCVVLASNNRAGTILNNIQHQRNFFIQHSASPTHYPHCGSTPSTIGIMLSNWHIAVEHICSQADIRPCSGCLHYYWKHWRQRGNTIVSFQERWLDFISNVHQREDWLRHADTLPTNSNDIDSGIDHLIKLMHEAKERSVPTVSKHNNFIHLNQDTKTAISNRNALKRQWQRCTHADRKTATQKPDQRGEP